jgi:hypothetical protein
MLTWLKRLLFGPVQDADRLGTLSRRLDDIESRVRTLTSEWLDTLDRIERVLGRLVKRGQRAQAATEGEDASSPGNGAALSSDAAPAPGDEVARRRTRLVNPARR